MVTDLRGPGDCYGGRRPDTDDRVTPDVRCSCGWIGFRVQLVSGDIQAECPECFGFDFEIGEE